MATTMLRKDYPPKPSPADEQTTEIPPTKRNCWQRLREKVCGKKSSQVQVANGENTTSSGTAAPGHKKQEKIINGQPERRNGNPGSGDKPEVSGGSDKDNSPKPLSSAKRPLPLPNNQENRYASPSEKSSGPRIGEKKTASSLPKASGSSAQDAKANTDSSLKQGYQLHNEQESRYRVPEEKSSESHGVGDKKVDSKQPEALGSTIQDAKAKNGSSLTPGHILQKKQESSYRVPKEKSSGSHGVGDKKVDSKQPEALGSTIQDAKAKNGSSLIPGHILQNRQESSYRVPAEKSSGSHGVGDKKVDSKQPEALGSTIQDAKAKNGSSLIPGHILQNKQESSYRIPAEKSSGSNGVGDRNVDSKQPEALGISAQDAKTKPVSSLVPGHLLPNKQEISYASPGEKSKGSPGAGDRKMDSKLPETLGSYVQDAKPKTGSSLVPGHLFQNKQENSYASPAEKSKESPGSENRKKDSKLPETGSSVQDAKAKTRSSHKPGHLLQNNQENSYGSRGIGNKQVYSKLPDASGSSHQDAKSKTVTSLKPELQNKKENSYGRPGVGEKKMDSKLPEDLRISDQNAKAKTVSTIKPDHLLQNKQGTSSPEQLVHNAPPRGDVKQEDINKNGKCKDPKPQKLTISGFEHSSEEQGKANLPARNEKQKDIVKHPSYKNVDNMTTKSLVAPTSSEQQKDIQPIIETEVTRKFQPDPSPSDIQPIIETKATEKLQPDSPPADIQPIVETNATEKLQPDPPPADIQPITETKAT
ncbi:hypothetical protein Patl1_27613 [Pistacia atlantica]|uniref:Uncharacterized protein n=1 Tax=Pistacia atlantica TaxID=434234 RepID=A0ACC1BG59_9ROSI|nr:hypothetical protein Patl1_27613 [Pistacia atlantica]